LKKTLWLILLCVVASLVYWSLLHWYADADLLAGLVLFSGESFFLGRFWIVITALFIHGSLTHLVGNMLFLYVFGTVLEDEFGAGKTLAAFFSGGASSFVLSLFFYGFNTLMFGASAAIFTLTAIVMLTKPLKFSWAFLMPLGLVALLYFLYNVAAVLSLSGSGNVGYLTHIIGFAVGFPFGIAWSPSKWSRNLLIAVALLIIYFVIMSLFFPFLERFLF